MCICNAAIPVNFKILTLVATNQPTEITKRREHFNTEKIV